MISIKILSHLATELVNKFPFSYDYALIVTYLKHCHHAMIYGGSAMTTLSYDTLVI